ncbi:MAG TPA: hypothetical protein VGN80_05710 [Devosiaceae bacterium]|jgi:hypothetical protein|nr:hypothetical protein [Devosiaceae bacterium]
MPRYYFDVSDGAAPEADEFGKDCNSDVDAGNEAIKALTGLARDHLYQGDPHQISVIVRREGGERVLVAQFAIAAA